MKKILQFLWIPLLLIIVYQEYNKRQIVEPKIEIKEPIKEPEIKAPTTPQIELMETTFEDLANWQNDNDIGPISQAFFDSCKKIKNEKNEFLSNSAIRIPTEDYKRICNEFVITSEGFKSFVEKKFTPYLVLDNGSETGKFTSYYESRINASYNKSAKYKYPIYGKPKDLIEIRLKDIDETLPNKTYIGRVKDGRVAKYYTRKEIYEKAPNAPVILWADDFVDVYVMHIQGSAVAHLDTGKNIRVGYAENNGHPFRGIGSILLSKGLLKPGEASMGQIKKWLKSNGKTAINNMLENDRYVFQRIVEADGPIGAQGVSLKSGRSIAVDRSYIPLGSLLWLETVGPKKEKIEKLVIAQDIGSAIKGPIRGDYFWGSGNDEILDLAGKMNSQGRYFILLPKNIKAEVKND